MICLIKVIKDIGQSNYRGIMCAADHKKTDQWDRHNYTTFHCYDIELMDQAWVFLGVILLPDSIRQLLTISK